MPLGIPARSRPACLWNGIAARSSDLSVAHLMPSLFQVQATDGKSRTGLLRLSHGELETPSALIYTRRGGALHLTPDTLETLGPSAQNMYLDASQLCVRIRLLTASGA